VYMIGLVLITVVSVALSSETHRSTIDD